MGRSARRFVGWSSTHHKFPAVFAKSENGFVPGEFCFVAQQGTKHWPFAKKTRGPRNWFIGRSQI